MKFTIEFPRKLCDDILEQAIEKESPGGLMCECKGLYKDMCAIMPFSIIVCHFKFLPIVATDKLAIILP